MTGSKNFFLLLIFSLALVARPSAAQNYIDIDLTAPKAKELAKPTPPVKKPPKPAPKRSAKPQNKPAQAAQSTAPFTPKPATKPTAKETPIKTPKAVVKLPAPKPKSKIPVKPAVKAPVDAPAPTVNSEPELKLDEPAPTKPAAKPPTESTPVPKIEAPPTDNADAKNQMLMLDEDDQPRFKNRHAFAVDYTTWYETMKLKNKTTNALTEANSHYFGVAFNYDFTVYREKYGFAITLGSVTGNAQAGTKDAGDYYERRIVWTGFRGGGRLFFRANNRIDLGLGFMAQSKATKWPEEENFLVLPQANPQYFYYLDTRWRLNYRYEIVQAFGAHLRSYALAWMLGINYTLN